MNRAISLSVRRCTLQFTRTTRIRDFAIKLTGQRMLCTSLSVDNSLDRLLKPSMVKPDEVNHVYGLDDEIPKMKAAWSDIVHELTETGPFQILPEAMKHIAEAMEYNIPAGNARRYFTLLYVYKNLVPANQITEENLHLARILGWCCELCLGGYFIYDDIIDNAETRRFKLCWHKKNDIGIHAFTDAAIILHFPLELVSRYFKGHPFVYEFSEVLRKVMLKVYLSLSADTVASNFGKKPDLNNYTMDLYNRVVLYKNGYTLMLPVELAIYLAGIRDPEMLRQIELIMTVMGRFFQVENDYRDCYGDEKYKSERDIEEGTFTWLIAAALSRVTPEQRKILDECYGEKDPEKIAKVKEIYDDLGMRNIYATYEEQSYNLVNVYIQQLSCGIPHEIFFNIRDNIYGTREERARGIK